MTRSSGILGVSTLIGAALALFATTILASSGCGRASNQNESTDADEDSSEARSDADAETDRIETAPWPCSDVGIERLIPGGCGGGACCDGAARDGCRRAYQCRICEAGIAYATCTRFSYRCVPADKCTDSESLDAAAIATCRCGAGPACGPAEVCVGDTPTSVPTCRCLPPVKPCSMPDACLP